MASKAAKLAQRRRVARAGRPRKDGVDRYPGGQIKHGSREDDAQSVALEARKRVHGINVSKLAKKQHDGPDPRLLSGYTLGRIFLDGKINEAQLRAGDRYTEEMVAYYSLTGIPFPSARAQDVNRAHGFDGDHTQARQDAARRQSNIIMGMEGALGSCASGPQVKTTVRNVCLMDYEHLRGMSDTQMDFLCRGLSALHWHMELKGAGKSGNNEITE